LKSSPILGAQYVDVYQFSLVISSRAARRSAQASRVRQRELLSQLLSRDSVSTAESLRIEAENGRWDRNRTCNLRLWSLLPFVQQRSGKYTNSPEMPHLAGAKYVGVHQSSPALGSKQPDILLSTGCHLGVATSSTGVESRLTDPELAPQFTLLGRCEAGVKRLCAIEQYDNRAESVILASVACSCARGIQSLPLAMQATSRGMPLSQQSVDLRQVSPQANNHSATVLVTRRGCYPLDP